MQTNLPSHSAFTELFQSIFAALETYSNVHRGSGHHSMATSKSYDQARSAVLRYLGLGKGRYSVIFCTPRRATTLQAQLKTGDYRCISSQDIGLPLGVTAMAVKKRALPKGAPFQTGGGTTRLMSGDWVLWAIGPEKFEAGTPAIINVIAFAKALQMVQKSGRDLFLNAAFEKMTVKEILHTDDLQKFSSRELLDELRKTLIGRGIQVPTKTGSKVFVNLDNSASTPTFLPVWNALQQGLIQPEPIRKEIVSEVKTILSEFLGAPATDYDILCTSNTTEAINLASESFSREFGPETEPVILNTLLEHSSNDLPWRMIPGGTLIRLSIDQEGFVDLDELETILRDYNLDGKHGHKRIRLVAVSGASNVLGICNDLDEISRITHRYGARLLVDAAQLVAHREINILKSAIDYLAFSAHKIYAPFGSGALVVRQGLLKFTPEEMEQIRMSGEENTAGICALGKAVTLLQRIGMDIIREEEKELTSHAIVSMNQISGLKIYGVNNPGSPSFDQKIGVIIFAIDGIISIAIAKQLASQAAIGIRYGCQCAHILIKHLLGVSPGLERFQRVLLTLLPNLRLPGLARVSFGIQNTTQDVDTLVQALGNLKTKTK